MRETEAKLMVYNAATRVSQELGNVSTAQILGSERTFKVASARQMVYWYLWNVCKMSFSDIGKAMGKNHATILYGVRQAETMIESEKSYGSKYRKLAQKLKTLNK